MAAPGRKPPPTALKLVRGDKKHTFNDDEPQPGEGIPVCPSTDKAVNDVWDYTVAQLAKMRVITLADRDVLYAYCQAVVQHQKASDLLAGSSPVQGRTNSASLHPALRAQRDQAAIIKALGAEFGMTPSSRSRIKVADQQPAKEQGASRLLSG